MMIPRNTRTHTQKKGGAALHFVFVFRRCITLKVDEWIRFECVCVCIRWIFRCWWMDGWMDRRLSGTCGISISYRRCWTLMHRLSAAESTNGLGFNDEMDRGWHWSLPPIDGCVLSFDSIHASLVDCFVFCVNRESERDVRSRTPLCRWIRENRPTDRPGRASHREEKQNSQWPH